jgi:hypothetical protein
VFVFHEGCHSRQNDGHWQGEKLATNDVEYGCARHDEPEATGSDRCHLWQNPRGRWHNQSNGSEQLADTNKTHQSSRHVSYPVDRLRKEVKLKRHHETRYQEEYREESLSNPQEHVRVATDWLIASRRNGGQEPNTMGL